MAKTAEPDGHERRFAVVSGQRPVFTPRSSEPSVVPEFPAVARARQRKADLDKWLTEAAEVLDGS